MYLLTQPNNIRFNLASSTYLLWHKFNTFSLFFLPRTYWNTIELPKNELYRINAWNASPKPCAAFGRWSWALGNRFSLAKSPHFAARSCAACATGNTWTRCASICGPRLRQWFLCWLLQPMFWWAINWRLQKWNFRNIVICSTANNLNWWFIEGFLQFGSVQHTYRTTERFSLGNQWDCGIVRFCQTSSELFRYRWFQSRGLLLLGFSIKRKWW